MSSLSVSVQVPFRALPARVIFLCYDTFVGGLGGKFVPNNQPDFGRYLGALIEYLVNLNFKIILISSSSPKENKGLFRLLTSGISARIRQHISDNVIHSSSLTQAAYDQIEMSRWYKNAISQIMQKYRTRVVFIITCDENFIGAGLTLFEDRKISNCHSGIVRVEQPECWCDAINLVTFLGYTLNEMIYFDTFQLINIQPGVIRKFIRNRGAVIVAASTGASTGGTPADSSAAASTGASTGGTPAVASDNSSADSSADASGNSSVVASGNSSAVASGDSSVVAFGNSSAVASGNSSAVASGNSTVISSTGGTIGFCNLQLYIGEDGDVIIEPLQPPVQPLGKRKNVLPPSDQPPSSRRRSDGKGGNQ